MSYVENEPLMAAYDAAQHKYADTVRESDKVLLGLIGRLRPKTLLDIGCSTGNLLLHIRRAFPEIKLTGGDLAQSSLDVAKQNKDLCDVDLRLENMLDISGHYDCIVANAVACCFPWSDYERAIDSIAAALNPGGTYIAFEWLHPHQDLHIIEANEHYPEGLSLYFRNQTRVAAAFAARGLSVEISPFTMPFQLAVPSDPLDLTSHTKTLATGELLCFRGVLYQPWCHVVATKY